LARARLALCAASGDDRGVVVANEGDPVNELLIDKWTGATMALRRLARRCAGECGQGTVEYVGLILLVSMLMVGMVAAMKGFNGTSGTEIAEVIINKIKQAVNAITFR
jgi:hypothetical protein